MNKRNLWLGIFVAGALVVVLLLNCQHLPIWFRSPAVSATVVDGKTGKPLAGVTVNVRWSVMRSTENMHDPESRELFNTNVTTDAHGVFNVPAWGPVSLKWGWFYFSTDPEVYFPGKGRDGNIIYNRNEEGYNEIQPWPGQTVTYELPSWNNQKIPLSN